jgi:Tfp pilus assembly protein PilZ
MMAHLTVQYSGSDESFEAYSCNVCYGGMGFYSSNPVQVGREILIKIFYSPDGNTELLENIAGTVRWCKPIGKMYGAGVQFKVLDPDRQPLLFTYIESALQFHHVRPTDRRKSLRSKGDPDGG